MKNRELIERLQLLDPEHDVLVEASDGGQPFAISRVGVDTWEDEGEEPSPIVLLGIVC